MSKRILLVDTQLSNYSIEGIYDLACDSGWQMCINRIRITLRLVPDLEVHVTIPDKVKQHPDVVNPDLFVEFGNRLKCVVIRLTDNALANRYDFNWWEMKQIFYFHSRKLSEFTHVYINDPMRLRAWKTLFHLVGKNCPRFVVHSHFVDVPSCPKFPQEASLWLGQCEAAIKADYNFWQCGTALDQFSSDFLKTFRPSVLDEVLDKSSPWDDGFSEDEIKREVDISQIRFSRDDFFRRTKNKTIVFVPNRIGGKGRSSDYTNCGKFLEEVPKLLHDRCPGKFAFIAGNPNAKFSNNELDKSYGQYGYLKLTDDTFNREEYKWLARHSKIAVGLYDQDTYGGTAARELVSLGCLPLWLRRYEYERLSDASGYEVGMSDTLEPDELADVLVQLSCSPLTSEQFQTLRQIVKEECSYESTSEQALPYLFGENWESLSQEKQENE